MSHWIIRLHVPWFSTWGESAVVKSVNTPVTGGIPTFPEMLKATLATADP